MTRNFQNCNKSDEVPKSFNNSHKTSNATQKNNREAVNGNQNNFTDNKLRLLLQSIDEYFSKGSLDKAESILNEAEELFIPADIKAWRHKIQETKLKVQQENDKRRRQEIESLKSEEKEAFDCIEKAKNAIICQDLMSTDKHLRDALDLITVSTQNVSRNMKIDTEQNKRRKVSNVLERAMQTEALKFVKEAEQAFFNYKFDEAEKLLLISERISPDEYVDEMIVLIENAKRDSISKERIEKLRKTFFQQSNTEQKTDFNNFDFAKTFKIYNGFDKVEELLKTIENLYPDKKAKEFFRQIRIATENQSPSNYNFYGDESAINESNKVEAFKCLSKANQAYCEGNFEKAEQLSKKSDRMYPTEEAKALLNDITITKDKEQRDKNYEDEERTKEALEYMRLVIPAIQRKSFDEAETFIARCQQMYYNPILDYTLDKILKLCIARMREVKRRKRKKKNN